MIMASEIRSDLGIELSDLSYPDIHVHVAYNNHFGGPWSHGGLQMASEVVEILEATFEL